MEVSAGGDSGVTTGHSERVYRRRGFKWVACLAVAGSAGLLVLLVRLISTPQGHGGDAAGEYLFAAYLFLLVLLLLWQGRRLWRVRVVVTPDSITVDNLEGKSHHQAFRHEIESIDLMSKKYGRSAYYVRSPYVKLKNGGGFFLDCLAGAREDKPIKPEQLAQVNEIRRTLGVGGSDAFHVRLPHG